MNDSASSLRRIEEIPLPFRDVFSEYPCFNIVQSQVLDSILLSDKSLVVAAPTGSGKTVIFELAIVKLLCSLANPEDVQKTFKIVYISPIKSLCQEKLDDWQKKLTPFGLNVISITGDSERMDFSDLEHQNLIISTPEKWDSLTRNWRQNEKIVKEIKLFMIDEVHLLNEDTRGSTLEVIVSRMKTVENSLSRTQDDRRIRFMAVSATIPNVGDIAEWIGDPSNVEYFKFSEEVRPVKLKKIVIGYNYNAQTMTPFKFDLTLNYKLQFLMMQHAEGKPTLIFCSTRKSVEMTAKHLVQTLRIQLSGPQLQKLSDIADKITDLKARDFIKQGIGFHHAGLIPEIRHIIEDIFRKGDLPVLVTTSTLAMGVNLPAHLVIIKFTKCYDKCGFRDYSETAMHQMIGRAGRPQFDSNATVLILTTKDDQQKFEKMMGCTEPVESNLHHHLTEHLNAEVVLGTITDLEVAMQWLASTFLYVRAMKNPRHYGLPIVLTKSQIEQKLLDICQIHLNKLVTAGMINMDQNIVITSTNTGMIMARYYVAFETMKLFTQITGTEVLMQILALISKCKEFSDIHLRVNDKKSLNLINKTSNKNSIRFPLNGKIKSDDMKVNCLIQAVLGNLEIPDSSMNESFTIMRNGGRITKCLIDYLSSRRENSYNALLNAIILGKCFRAKLWEDSQFLTKQLNGIGNVLSSHLANAGIDSFDKILASNPRNVEMILKKKPPFGDYLIEEVRCIPRYRMTLENTSQDELEFKLMIRLINIENIQERSTVDVKSVMTLLVGTNLNDIIIHERYQHSYMIENAQIMHFFKVDASTDLEIIEARFISEDWVGIDCCSELILPKLQTKANKRSKDRNGIEDNTKPTYLQTFLDMYRKIEKPLQKDQRNEITSKKLNVSHKMSCKSDKKDGSYKKNTAICIKSTRKPDAILQNQSDLLQPDINERMKQIVEKVAESNDSFRFMRENRNIMETNSDHECDNADKDVQCEQDCVNIVAEHDKSLENFNFEEFIENKCDQERDINNMCEKVNNFHDESNVEDPPYPENNDYPSTGFLKSLGSEKNKTNLPDEHKSKDNYTNIENQIEKKSATKSSLETSVGQNHSMKFSEMLPDEVVESNLGKIDDFLNTSNPCLLSEVESDMIPVNKIAKHFDTTKITHDAEVDREKKKVVSINFDHAIKSEPRLCSINQRYVSEFANQKRCSSQNNSSKRNFNSTIPRNNSCLPSFLSSIKKQKNNIETVHPAEELEDKILKEDTRKKYLDDFKKPDKKRMSHYTHEENFPDSTMTNLIPITGFMGEKSEGPKLYDNVGLLGYNDDKAEYTKKSIKWRSPLVFSPSIKFSPKVNVSKTPVDDEIQNNVSNESFDTSISSRQRTPKQFRPSQLSLSGSKRGTKFPLCDNDYGTPKSSKKLFSELTDPSTPKKFSKSKTSSATDYYKQCLTQTSAHAEKEHTKEMCQKTQQNSLNLSFIENQENIPTNSENIVKETELSQSLFGSQDNINGDEVKFLQPDIRISREPSQLEQRDATFSGPQEYCDVRNGLYNYPPLNPYMKQYSAPDPCYSQPLYAHHSYRPFLHNENMYPVSHYRDSAYKPGCHGWKCCQMRPYEYQAHSVDLDQSRYLSSPHPEDNYRYSLRSPKPIYHQLNHSLNASMTEDTRNRYFPQVEIHDQSHRIPPTRIKTNEEYCTERDPINMDRSSQPAVGKLDSDIFNRSFQENNFSGYQYFRDNMSSRRNYNMQGLNDPFTMRNRWLPCTQERYNHNLGFQHNSQNSHHNKSFLDRPVNFTRPYDFPSRNHDNQLFPPPDDEKDYVMDKFLYSLNP